MSLTLTTVLEYIEYRLGASHAEVLELTKFDMVQTIRKVTIPTFSSYYPALYNIKVDCKADMVDNQLGVYYIKTEHKILGVTKLLPWSSDVTGRVSDRLFHDPIDQFIANSMDGINVTPLTFDFIPPNKFEIFPKYSVYGHMLVQIKAQHNEHLNGIHLGYEEEFKSLALYDVAIGLKAIRHRFNNLSTIYGSIELSTELMEQAEDKRTELIQKFRENFNKNSKRRKLFII
jgi:hypothetical protein